MHCKELEQIKNEYRNIPVPAEGVAKLQPVMQRAREKRALRRPVVKYGALAAAAVLLVLLIPGMGRAFLMGSAAGGSDTAYDAAMKNSAETVLTTGEASAEAETENGRLYTYNYQANLQTEAVVEEAKTDGAVQDTMVSVLSIEERKAIEAEILLQMEEREEEFYEFTSLSQEQVIYLDETGCLNVVFPAGSIAAEEYGEISFVIPQDVFSAQE